MLYAISGIYGIYGYEGLYIFVRENNFYLLFKCLQNVCDRIFYRILARIFRISFGSCLEFQKYFLLLAIDSLFRVVSSLCLVSAILRHEIPFSFPHSFASRDQQHERDLKATTFVVLLSITPSRSFEKKRNIKSLRTSRFEKNSFSNCFDTFLFSSSSMPMDI